MKNINRKNKKYNYKTRYYQGEENPYQLKHKFDEFRTTVGKNKSLKGKFTTAINEFKDSGYQLNKTILIIVCVLILLFLFFIDFDLSIFLPKN